MSDFWKSYDITAAEYGAGYECYPLFGTVHLIELALSALFLLGMVWWYRRSTLRTRRHILVGVTAALLADEAALLLGMACTGQWNWSYLPLHLCSINVFVCLYNTLTDRSWCKEELYALCIPGAALALLCPSWPGCARVVHPHQPALGQHPRPAGALPCAAGGGRIPPQRASGAAGAGLFVRLGPAHLFS